MAFGRHATGRELGPARMQRLSVGSSTSQKIAPLSARIAVLQWLTRLPVGFVTLDVLGSIRTRSNSKHIPELPDGLSLNWVLRKGCGKVKATCAIMTHCPPNTDW